MNDKERMKILQDRDYLVTKSNEIVLNSRYELSVQEQRAICYICSKIKPAEKDPSTWQLEYNFNIIDYARTCGLDGDSGRFYAETKGLLKSLESKVFWLKLSDDVETTVRWISKSWIYKKSGRVKIRIDEDLAPHLFALREKFVSYGLINILAMRSQYAIRLYEMLKANEYHHKAVFNLDDLKRQLMVGDSYNRYPDLRRTVLDTAVNEINSVSDLDVSYEATDKQGRRVTEVTFYIREKSEKNRILTNSKVNDILDNQMSFDDFPEILPEKDTDKGSNRH